MNGLRILESLILPDAEPELIDDFAAEAREQLALAERALLALDRDPGDSESLDAVFGAFHTIKSTSAFFGIEHATELAHHAEALLALMRAGSATCAGAPADLLFRALDVLDAMLVALEYAGPGKPAPVPSEYRALVTELRRASTDVTAAPFRAIAPVAQARPAGGEHTIRVSAEELDRLDEIVVALTRAHAGLSREPALRSPVHADLARRLAHAERLMIALRESAAELRTVPFAPMARRLARAARDAAHRGGKTIEFVVQGEDMVIDRATAETLADPLMHMVRNAIDHGIEPADERVGAAKPAAGMILLHVERDGADLVIRLSDDGRGLGAREADTLIGANLDALGGTVDVDSVAGTGTAFTIRVPFRSAAPDAGAWSEPPRTIGLIA